MVIGKHIYIGAADKKLYEHDSEVAHRCVKLYPCATLCIFLLAWISL